MGIAEIAGAIIAFFRGFIDYIGPAFTSIFNSLQYLFVSVNVLPPVLLGLAYIGVLVVIVRLVMELL